MKLSTYAKQLGISYSTAWRMWKRGEIAGYQLASGTVIVTQPEQESHVIRKVAIYARVSNRENQNNRTRRRNDSLPGVCYKDGRLCR